MTSYSNVCCCCFSIGTHVEAEHVQLRLWIGAATKADSGNYSCVAPGATVDDFPRATIKIIVMEGERAQSRVRLGKLNLYNKGSTLSIKKGENQKLMYGSFVIM